MKKKIRPVGIPILPVILALATITAPALGAEEPRMVRFDGGHVRLGNDDLRRWDAPEHDVILSPFEIGTHEVSVSLFREFVDETGYDFDWTPDEMMTTRSLRESRPDDWPMTALRFIDAATFCNWLSRRDGYRRAYNIDSSGVRWDRNADGYRLPTEAEWEFTARDGLEGNGLTLALRRIARRNPGGDTLYPVDRAPATAAGVHGLYGNAREWCWDLYSVEFYGASPQTDPVGPEQSDAIDRYGRFGKPVRGWRVTRGAYYLFESDATYIDPAVRNPTWPEDVSDSLGFRVARTPDE